MKTLTFWALADNGFDTAETIGDLLRDFSREAPDVEVRVEVKPYGALWEALFSALKNPREYPRPDLVEIPCTWGATFGHMGLLEDLAVLAPQIRLDAWLPELRPYCAAPGKPDIISLPWWTSLRVLYYRRDILDKAGIRPETGLATWDGFLETCRQLHGKWGHQDTFHLVANPNPRDSLSLIDLAPPVWAFGGQFFSSDGRRSLFHREESFRGISAYLTLMAEGWMPLLGRSGLILKDLFEGHAAFQFSGRFPRSVLAGPRSGREKVTGLGAKIGAVPFPSGPARSQTILASRQLAVVKGSKYAREAAQCVLYLAQPSAGSSYARSVGGLPCSAAAFEGWFRSREDLRQTFTQSFGRARTLPPVSALGVTERVLERAMESVLEAILRRSYKPEHLREQIIYAAAEVDYILSLYE